jgi:hypothetical protein
MKCHGCRLNAKIQALGVFDITLVAFRLMKMGSANTARIALIWTSAAFFCLSPLNCSEVFAQNLVQKLGQRESSSNTVAEPKQMLRTGVDLCEPGLSVNSLQLATSLGILPILKDIEALRQRLAGMPQDGSLERLNCRQELTETVQKAILIIQKTNLDADFTIAEIQAEQMVYTEILDSYYDDRDRALARTNALSFMSNGALWAVCEGLAIPTYKHSRYAISSGITGILAGIVPSIASMYTLKQVNGKRKRSETEPNMLAKLFDYPTNIDIEYPKSIWNFLNEVPANEPGKKSRREQMIDGWIADANIHTFTDRNSKRQLDIITASVPHRNGLTIETLEVRTVMLQKLTGEIMKMKRMLLELNMAVIGEKQCVAYDEGDRKHVSSTVSGGKLQ